MSISREEIYAKVQVTLIDALGVDDDEITEDARLMEDLGVQTPSLRRPVKVLSGGNQQKVVLAKWLFSDARVLLFDEPTRGVDVGAKVEIYRLLNGLARKGVGILMISSRWRLWRLNTKTKSLP